MAVQKSTIDCGSLITRILHDTGVSGKPFRKVRMMFPARSESESKADPTPPDTEKLLGHPY